MLVTLQVLEMDKIEQIPYFDLLSGESIFIENIGYFKSPTLKEVSQVGYSTYLMYLNFLIIKLDDFLKLINLTEKYEALTEEEKEYNTLFRLIIGIGDSLDIISGLFELHIKNPVVFNADMEVFEIYDVDYNIEDSNNILVGTIDNNNFDFVRNIICQMSNIDCKIQAPQKFTSERAKKLFERTEKNKYEQKMKNGSDNLDIPNMISKYCVANKQGINIINVWDMTIYQLYDQFYQLIYIRKSDNQDDIYANTVSFSDLSKYDDSLWLKSNKK